MNNISSNNLNGFASILGSIFGALSLVACDVAPTVDVASASIDANSGTTQVDVIIRNRTSIPITNVRLVLTCNDVSGAKTIEVSTLCDRKEKRRVLNRMTGSYETRDWTVCDSLSPMGIHKIPITVPGEFQQNACRVELKGYTDFRTLTQ